MRRLARFLLPFVILAFAVGPVAADPGHPGDAHGGLVTDDPTLDEDPLAGFDGAGLQNVELGLGGQPSALTAQKKSRNVSLVGSLQGPAGEYNLGVFGDVAGYKNLAFIGKWRGACPGTGVDIIDISTPSAPTKLADTNDYADTSMEDMQAIKIGNRDILAVGLQDCGNIATPGVGESGLDLYDISDPDSPQFLAKYDVDDEFGADVGGIHELDVVANAAGQTLILASVPDLEAITSDDAGLNGTGDLLIIDISDPEHPALVGEWGVLDELGLAFYLDVRQGADGRTLLHSPRANDDGTRVYLSYWDAGYITLDISDPANPVFLGRAPMTSPSDSYAAGEEGNAHSTATARDETMLIGADEDFSPFHLEFTSSAFTGTRDAVEGAFTPPIVNQPGRVMSGQVVHVGRGCPALSINGTNPADPYLADPAGKIALIERGACRFDNKIGRAQLAGATGVIVYNNAAGGEALVLMGGNDPVTLADGTVVDITFSAIFVQRSTGLLLAGGTPPVTASASAVFDGWGYLRFFDNSDPANPVQVGTYATPNTNNEAVATTGTWSVHNPEVRGNTVFASWYSDGVRVLDITKPSNVKEIGFWTGAGAPAGAPAVNIWSVVPHGSLLLVSDRNYGLYILKVNASKP